MVRHYLISFGSLQVVSLSSLDIFKTAYLKSLFSMINNWASSVTVLLTSFLFLSDIQNLLISLSYNFLCVKLNILNDVVQQLWNEILSFTQGPLLLFSFVY